MGAPLRDDLLGNMPLVRDDCMRYLNASLNLRGSMLYGSWQNKSVLGSGSCVNNWEGSQCDGVNDTTMILRAPTASNSCATNRSINRSNLSKSFLLLTILQPFRDLISPSSTFYFNLQIKLKGLGICTCTKDTISL